MGQSARVPWIARLQRIQPSSRNQGPQLTPITHHVWCILYGYLWISMDLGLLGEAVSLIHGYPWPAFRGRGELRKGLEEMGVKIDPASFKALMGLLGCGRWNVWILFAFLCSFAMLPYVASLYGKIEKCWHMLTHQIKYIYIYTVQHLGRMGMSQNVPISSNIYCKITDLKHPHMACDACTVFGRFCRLRISS